MTKHYFHIAQTLTLTVLLLTACGVKKQTAVQQLYYGFDHPQDSARTKVWWFFGETETTREGITADLEAFRREGVGGVVYYDQVHGKGEGASKVFSAEWWQEVTFAAQEAHRLGLSFEVNIGNGYVAGGQWITPDKSMKRLAMTEALTNNGCTRLPLPRCPGDWHEDVAVLAVPYHEDRLGDSRLLGIESSQTTDTLIVFDFGRPFTARSITYETKPQGKARTSSMQVPPSHIPLAQPDPTRFYGCGFRELPDIGVLEASDDGVDYRPVCKLRPKYQNLGGLRQQTIAFPTTCARYFRIALVSTAYKVSNVVISARACLDEWEEKASLVSEFITDDTTPLYKREEYLSVDSIIDVTNKMSPDGQLTWNDAPAGQWLIMRFVAVSTGARTKHGRDDALGLECDKLSVEGARLHWASYTKPLIDSIRAAGGQIEGICMDSHEAGPQNWTHNMPEQFKRLRGYDIINYLPTIAGGLIVSSTEDGSRSLYDLRRTISDLITTNYYGEFQRLCHQESLTLTAQAIGGALCMAGDNIEVKRLIDKPQGEFWGYQTEGNYDIKDCSSAAHVYGKQIASGEAFTDITYKHALSDIKNLADYAYAFGINEFVVCAAAYQPYRIENGDSVLNRVEPWLKPSDNKSQTSNLKSQIKINTANGRQYVLNRINTQWAMSHDFWDYQARSSWMLRQGRPVSDLCLYLGDNVPKRILGHLLPPIPQGYNYDAFTTDVLLHRMSVKDGRITLPDGVSYSMLLLPADEVLTPDARQKIEEMQAQGATVWDPHNGVTLSEALSAASMTADVQAPVAKGLYMAHRRTGTADIYFLNNHTDTEMTGPFVFHASAPYVELWHPVTGQKTALMANRQDDHTTVSLTLAPRESYFIVFLPSPSTSHPSPSTSHPAPSGRVGGIFAATSFPPPSPLPPSPLTLTAPWMVKFDPACGGPAEAVRFEQLTDWSKHPDQRIRYYSGTATYTTTFTLQRKGHYLLAIDKPGSVAQVVVNGQEVATLWCAPWVADISPYIKKGVNLLEIRVANSLWNRLVGDASKPQSERLMLQTTPLAEADDELVPSGLMGTVRIVKQ